MAATDDFDSFYTAAFPRLAGQLALVTGDLHEAEDLVQEAMARAAPRWGRLRAYDSPEAWVRRVAFNLAVSGHCWACRRRRCRLGAPPPVPPVSVEAWPGPGPPGADRRRWSSSTTWPTCR